MIVATLVLAGMAVVLFVLAYRRGDGTHIRGLWVGKTLLVGVLPLLLLAFAVAGFIQVAVPPEIMRGWLGAGAGLKGILIGTVTGALIPGGPYVSFPIIAAIFHSGASIGTAVALVTGWAMLGIAQLPFELALIGPRFMAIRLLIVFAAPPLAGIVAQYLFGRGF